MTARELAGRFFPEHAWHGPAWMIQEGAGSMEPRYFAYFECECQERLTVTAEMLEDAGLSIGDARAALRNVAWRVS